MNLVIFGYGFVGSTVAEFIMSNCNHNVTIIDPKYFDNDPLDAILDADGVIICVPTPPGPTGSCDDRIVKEILAMCDARTKVLVKSSVTPNLIQDYDVNVVYSPEFLRQNHAKADFRDQPFMIFGHHKHNEEDADWWISVFKECFNDVEYIKTSRRNASMIKYIHNSWLATKVAFFHELYLNLPPEMDYNEITDILGMFPNIGSSHMKAPNDDGQLGYGGACFPKDVEAILKSLDHSILKQVHDTNYWLKGKDITNELRMRKVANR